MIFSTVVQPPIQSTLIVALTEAIVWSNSMVEAFFDLETEIGKFTSMGRSLEQLEFLVAVIKPHVANEPVCGGSLSVAKTHVPCWHCPMSILQACGMRGAT